MIIGRVAHESVGELIESIRTRLQAELDARLPDLAARHEEAVAIARRDAEAEADRKWAAQIPPPSASPEPASPALLAAFDAIDRAATASDMLRAIASAAAEVVPGTALFVGPDLDRWGGPSGNDAETPKHLLRDALGSSRIVKGEGAVAAPVIIDGVAVGVLFTAAVEERQAGSLELIARYAGAQLASLTARRLVQAQGWISTGTSGRPSDMETESESGGEGEDVQSARRYARLLVSEIKLYNEAAVHDGRAHRDLQRRLGAEIDRARRLYEQRVPSAVADRGRHFQNELVQTLAGGDPTLLG